VVHHLDAAADLGPLAPTQSVTVGVVLQNPNEAGEDAYLASLYDPSSPNYQNFLEPDQFNSSSASRRRPSSRAGVAGRRGPAGDDDRRRVELPPRKRFRAQVESAFATPLNTYSAGGRTFYANAVAPTVPASLPIATVLGLNNFNDSGRRTSAGDRHADDDDRRARATNVPQTGALSRNAVVDLRPAVHEPRQRTDDGDLRWA